MLKESLAARTFRVERDTALVKGGINEKYLFADDRGAMWLFKPMPAHEAAIEEGCYRLARTLGLSTPEVFGVVFNASVTGSLSRIIANRGNLRKRPPETLTPAQVLQVMELEVFDWLIGNFDTHCRNFLVDETDQVVTIDHGQAFLDGDYFEFDLAAGPRYRLQSYFRDLWNGVKSGTVHVELDRVFAFVDRVAALPDSALDRIFRPFATMKRGALGYVMKSRYGDRVYATEDQLLFALARRKSELRAGFAAFFGHVSREMGKGAYRAPPAAAADFAYTIPELDARPLAIHVVDEHHRFGFFKRLGRKISIKAATLEETGFFNVAHAVEQRVLTAFDEVRHAFLPMIHGGLTSGLVTRFDFSAELDPTLGARIGRTGPDVLKLFRERSLFAAFQGGDTPSARRARQVLAMIATVLRP